MILFRQKVQIELFYLKTRKKLEKKFSSFFHSTLRPFFLLMQSVPPFDG